MVDISGEIHILVEHFVLAYLCGFWRLPLVSLSGGCGQHADGWLLTLEEWGSNTNQASIHRYAHAPDNAQQYC